MKKPARPEPNTSHLVGEYFVAAELSTRGWAVALIRRMVGHERFSGIVAGQALAQLLQAVRLYVNYFQPSFKLRERVREGSKVKKSYYPCA